MIPKRRKIATATPLENDNYVPPKPNPIVLIDKIIQLIGNLPKAVLKPISNKMRKYIRYELDEGWYLSYEEIPLEQKRNYFLKEKQENICKIIDKLKSKEINLLFSKFSQNKFDCRLKKDKIRNLIAIMQNDSTDYDKRNIEKENLKKAPVNFNSIFISLFRGKFIIPLHLFDHILKFCPKNILSLNSIGLVNSNWYKTLLLNWDKVIISQTNYMRIPYLTVLQPKHIIIKINYSTRGNTKFIKEIFGRMKHGPHTLEFVLSKGSNKFILDILNCLDKLSSKSKLSNNTLLLKNINKLIVHKHFNFDNKLFKYLIQNLTSKHFPNLKSFELYRDSIQCPFPKLTDNKSAFFNLNSITLQHHNYYKSILHTNPFSYLPHSEDVKRMTNLKSLSLDCIPLLLEIKKLKPIVNNIKELQLYLFSKNQNNYNSVNLVKEFNEFLCFFKNITKLYLELYNTKTELKKNFAKIKGFINLSKLKELHLCFSIYGKKTLFPRLYEVKTKTPFFNDMNEILNCIYPQSYSDFLEELNILSFNEKLTKCRINIKTEVLLYHEIKKSSKKMLSEYLENININTFNEILCYESHLTDIIKVCSEKIRKIEKENQLYKEMFFTKNKSKINKLKLQLKTINEKIDAINLDIKLHSSLLTMYKQIYTVKVHKQQNLSRSEFYEPTIAKEDIPYMVPMHPDYINMYSNNKESNLEDIWKLPKKEINEADNKLKKLQEQLRSCLYTKDRCTIAIKEATSPPKHFSTESKPKYESLKIEAVNELKRYKKAKQSFQRKIKQFQLNSGYDDDFIDKPWCERFLKECSNKFPQNNYSHNFNLNQINAFDYKRKIISKPADGYYYRFRTKPLYEELTVTKQDTFTAYQRSYK